MPGPWSCFARQVRDNNTVPLCPTIWRGKEGCSYFPLLYKYKSSIYTENTKKTHTRRLFLFSTLYKKKKNYLYIKISKYRSFSVPFLCFSFQYKGFIKKKKRKYSVFVILCASKHTAVIFYTSVLYKSVLFYA